MNQASVASPTAMRIRDEIAVARSSGGSLRIAGAGRWLDAGHPVEATGRLSLGGDAGIVDYVPGDLTLTAMAGTPLATIAEVTGPEGQWLTLDPFGGSAGTIGATIATASAGPLAHGFGLPRDNVLGLEFVTGTGLVARGGGRVVKNVAGFDLTRLLIGSWGTIGAVTELTVRLRALPEVDRTLALVLPDESAALIEFVDRVRRAPLAPMAMEMLNKSLARQLGLDARATLVVRLGGNARAVSAQQATLASLGPMTPIDTAREFWDALSRCEPADAAVLRLSSRPSRSGALWNAITGAMSNVAGVLVHATPARGVARCILPVADVNTTLVRLLGAIPNDVTRIGERLPARSWSMLGHPASAARLARGVKKAFDGERVLNRGILGEE